MTILDAKQQITENVKTIISKVIKLCDCQQMVKLKVGFYILNITGVHFNTNETLISVLLNL